AHPGSRIENQAMPIRRAYFHAGSIAPEFEVLSERSRGRATYAPEAYGHLPVRHLSECHLSTDALLVGLIEFQLQRRRISIARFRRVIERFLNVTEPFPDRGVFLVQPRHRLQFTERLLRLIRLDEDLRQRRPGRHK